MDGFRAVQRCLTILAAAVILAAPAVVFGPAVASARVPAMKDRPLASPDAPMLSCCPKRADRYLGRSVAQAA